MRYIKESSIREFVKNESKDRKRVGKEFLFALDCMIENKLKKAIGVHNGGKRTLDGGVARFIGAK